MNRPNLLVAGFQKCGSSSLFDLLDQHPQISGSIPKETFSLTDTSYEHFDSRLNISNPNFDWSSTFKQDGQEDSKYFLEGSVVNFYQKTALAFAMKNQVKVIFIIRDPIKRLVSNYKYYLARPGGIEAHLRFDDYLSMVKNGIFKREPLKFAIEHGMYCKYIENWKAQLGDDKVLVVSFENLVANTHDSFATIMQFLELENMKIDTLPWKNESRTPSFPRLDSFLIKTFGGAKWINGGFRKIYQKLLRNKRPSVTVTNQTRSYLEKLYYQEYRDYGALYE